MKTFNQSLLGLAAFALTSFAATAQEYNHGNHNDTQYTYSEGSVETVDCGSASLASCISAINIEAFSQGRCAAIKNVGGIFPWGSPYWHTAQSYAVRVVSAIDYNNGTGANNYSIDVKFSCSALLHPGFKTQQLPG
ncbi:MAG: hypothetical protein ACI8WB_000513 [Phenylobacterium sp.]|jgi:hypothetical protein